MADLGRSALLAMMIWIANGFSFLSLLFFPPSSSVFQLTCFNMMHQSRCLARGAQGTDSSQSWDSPSYERPGARIMGAREHGCTGAQEQHGQRRQHGIHGGTAKAVELHNGAPTILDTTFWTLNLYCVSPYSPFFSIFLLFLSYTFFSFLLYFLPWCIFSRHQGRLRSRGPCSAHVYLCLFFLFSPYFLFLYCFYFTRWAGEGGVCTKRHFERTQRLANQNTKTTTMICGLLSRFSPLSFLFPALFFFLTKRHSQRRWALEGGVAGTL